MPRKSFKQAYDETFQQAADKHFEGHFVIGQVNDFSPEEFTDVDADFLIHGKDIILLASPTYIHDKMASLFSSYLTGELNKAVSCQLFEASTGTVVDHFVSTLGCHYKQTKDPDGGVAISEEFQQNRTQFFADPIVCEVGFENETMFELLLEGVAWTCPYLDAEYCVLLKIKELLSGYFLRIVIIERIVESTGQTIFRHSSDVCQEPLKPFRADHLPTKDLEEALQIKIIFDVTLMQDELSEDTNLQDIVFDLAKLTKAAECPLSGRVIINLRDLLPLFRRTIYRHEDRQRLRIERERS